MLFTSLSDPALVSAVVYRFLDAKTAPGIIVGYDGSRGSLAAFDVAVAVGAGAGHDFSLVHARASGVSGEAPFSRFERDLQLRAAPRRVTYHVADCAATTPAACLIREAGRGRAAFIAAGTRGELGSGRFVGGTAAELLRGADVPVLLTPPEWKPPGRALTSIVVSIDRGDPLGAALTAAVSIARCAGARLHLRSVLESADIVESALTYGYDPQPFRDEMRAQSRAALRVALDHARTSGVEADAELVDATDRVRALCEEALRVAAELVICARLLRERSMTGSVTQRLASRSPLPVLVVPGDARHSDG